MSFVIEEVAFIHTTNNINENSFALCDPSSLAQTANVDQAMIFFAFYWTAQLALLHVDVGGHRVLLKVERTKLLLDSLHELQNDAKLPLPSRYGSK